MKTKLLVFYVGYAMLFFVLSGFKTTQLMLSQTCFLVSQELVAIGTYDGHEDYGYNFIVKNTDGDDVTLTFQKVEEAVLKSFDLDAEDLLNKKFKVTYKVDIVKSIDEHGFEDEDQINTIIKLEKL